VLLTHQYHLFNACEFDDFLNESRKKIHHLVKPRINKLEDISNFSFKPEIYLLGINILIKGANNRISSMWQKRILCWMSEHIRQDRIENQCIGEKVGQYLL